MEMLLFVDGCRLSEEGFSGRECVIRLPRSLRHIASIGVHRIYHVRHIHGIRPVVHLLIYGIIAYKIRHALEIPSHIIYRGEVRAAVD